MNVAHDAMHNNYLYNHTAYYHVSQQVIAFLVILAGNDDMHESSEEFEFQPGPPTVDLAALERLQKIPIGL